MNNFRYAELSVEQKEMLKEYKPENRHFTSWEEVAKVGKALCLDTMTDVEDMRAVRNSVVRLYSEIIEGANRDSSVAWDTMDSMQSVTAIIDHYMFKLNPQSV